MDLSSIEVMLFDLGNVMLPFNHYQIAEKLLPFVQRTEFQDPQKIFSYLFDWKNGAINDYETGRVSTIDFFQSVKEHLRLALSLEEFIPIWNDIFWEDEEVTRIILSLKGKKRLGLISNTNPLHFHYILSTFSVVKAFDRWFLSHEVGFKKPAPEIFKKALDWSGVNPEKILFIDDMKTHIDVAMSLGMHAIHFTSAQGLKERLSLES